jgi:hypothetical protein
VVTFPLGFATIGWCSVCGGQAANCGTAATATYCGRDWRGRLMYLPSEEAMTEPLPDPERLAELADQVTKLVVSAAELLCLSACPMRSTRTNTTRRSSGWRSRTRACGPSDHGLLGL